MSAGDGRLLDPGLLAALQAVRGPISLASGLPNAAYRSEAFAAFERDRVLARGWCCIGVGHDVPEPLDVRPLSFAGLPLILARTREGAIRVFHNVCSHRGMRLLSEPRSGSPIIRCPYHSWSYGLDGALRATPFIGGPGTADCPGFDRGRHGLKAVRSAVWADAVFVDLSGEAEDFARFIAPLAERWGHFDPAVLRHGGAESRFEIELDCNWKLAVENYCEGYHLPWVHRELNRYSRLEDHYNIALERRFAGQGSRAYRPSLGVEGAAFASLPGLPESWRGVGEYLALFPNVLFGLHQDHFFTVLIEPLAPGRTRERFEIYYFDDRAGGAGLSALRAANTAQWRTIFEEDRFVVEGMQQGRASPAFDGGAFSPVMDAPTHCFHDWLAAAALGEAGVGEELRAVG